MIHKHFADNTNKYSVATQLRNQRFQILLVMIKRLRGSVHILDIGGRPQYWEMMTAGLALDQRLHITLLNIEVQSVVDPNFTSVVGDGRDMPQFTDKQFDIVFSNSTIEHVGNLKDQIQMANEVMRLGQQYYVQTPNRYFPIEPHFVFPLFQFLPIKLRVWLVQHYALGWYRRIRDQQEERREVKSIRLLSRKELISLFPGAEIYEERFYRLVKSFVAHNPLVE